MDDGTQATACHNELMYTLVSIASSHPKGSICLLNETRNDKLITLTKKLKKLLHRGQICIIYYYDVTESKTLKTFNNKTKKNILKNF